MKASTVFKLILVCYLPFSAYYSANNDFEESSIEVDVPSGMSKEICINNSSVFTDMWNDRYLHIDSNHGDYTLYSKKTIFVSVLSDKHISDFIIKNSKYAPYSVDFRMYFSRCYIIENAANHKDDLHIRAYTYRKFCPVNTVVITFLAFILLCFPQVFIKEVIFYGASVLCFVASLTTLITYIDQRILTLAGVDVMKKSFSRAIPIIVFYSFFFVHICSFLLRIHLNYYHLSINEFGHIPRVVSFFGPLVCQYQYWVVGIYVVISLFILPCNRDGIRVSGFLGSILLVFLLYYGKEAFIHNLMSGIVIAVMTLTVLPFLWKNGYFFFLFPSPSIQNKKEVENNLKDVIDD